MKPDQSAVYAGATPTYTGSPTSGQISRWRSGTIFYTIDTTPSSLQLPRAWYLNTSLTAWVGQNLLAVGFFMPSLLPGGTVAASDCAILALPPTCDTHRMASPDRAFDVVYQQARAGNKITIPPNPEFHDYPAVPLAWRPDGKILATLLPPDGFHRDGSSLRVTLYDTATGKVIKTLSASRLANVNDNDDSIAPTYWSPAGSQLALVDTGSNSVTIWGASSLPA